MSRSPYTQLPTTPFTVRLLQLHPSSERSSPIACSLIPYPLAAKRSGAHLFEALSYVWGSQDDQQIIHIDTDTSSSLPFQVTRNLHLALVHLRDPVFERVLWCDAVCINQTDEKEKAYQVGSMANIYGLAQRVVVWLGEEGDNSALAFRHFNGADLSAHVLAQRSVREMANHKQRMFKKVVDEERGHEMLLKKGFSSARADENDAVRCQRAVLALFKRPYFRRIWIQQELAASRNILFMCGDSECEGETFREGRTLDQFDEHSVIESHPRTFRWLLRASSARQGLKGHGSLSLMPLGDLIDMFHAYDATDLRDKIYALLGMCSDVTRAAVLRPDYSIDWQTLLARLGTFMFGEGATVSAHESKELIFVRTSGFMLGKVDEVTSNGFWSDTQTVQIVALEPYRHLDELNRWNVRCKIRKSPKEVRKNDLVLLTKDERKVVIVRPEQFYFQIIMIADGVLAELLEGSKGTSRSWYPFLKRMDTYPIDFGLIWYWHKSHVGNESDSILLMNNGFCFDIDSRHADFIWVKALLDMAQTLDNCGGYKQALRILTDALTTHHRICRLEDLVLVEVRARQVEMQVKISRRKKVKKLIFEEARNTPDWKEYCSKMIEIAGEAHQHHTAAYEPELRYSPDKYWLRYASKAICNGDLVTMMTNAIALDKESHFSLLEKFADPSVYVSQHILISLASRRWGTRHIALLAKRVHCPITNLAGIFQTCAKTADDPAGKREMEALVTNLLEDTTCQVIVQTEAIEAALSALPSWWDKTYILYVLLNAAPDDLEISETMYRLVFAASKGAGKLMQLLLKRAGSNCKVPENVLVEAARDASECLEVFAVLIEHFSMSVVGTEAVLMAALDDVGGESDGGLISLLTYTQKVEVNDLVMNKARRSGSEDFIRNLSALREIRPITQKDVEATVANGNIVGYINMLTILRERSKEFKITKEIIKTAIIETAIADIYDCEGRSMLALLVDNADEHIIFVALYVESTKLLEHLAVQGAEDTLEKFYNRYSTPEIEGLLLIARLSTLIDPQRSPVFSDEHRLDKARENIYALQDYAKTHSSHYLRHLCRPIFNHAIRLGNSKVVTMLLDCGLTDNYFVNRDGETPLHIAARHLRDDSLCPTVVALCAGGGLKNLELEDVDGMTPLDILNEAVETSHDARVCGWLTDTLNVFSTMR